MGPGEGLGDFCAKAEHLAARIKLKRAMMQGHLRMRRKVSTQELGWIVSMIAQARG